MFVETRDQLDYVSKLGVKEQTASNGNPVVYMNNSFWLECEQNDTAFTPNAIRTGNWEAWNAVAMMRELGTRPSPVFVDIGANVGYYTLMSLAEGYKTYAFEPNISVFNNLINSVVYHNDLAYATPLLYNMGIGDKLESKFLHHFEGHSGADSFAYGSEDGEEAKLTTLDRVLTDTEGLNIVIKADVEGFEREAWDGAKTVRSDSKNVWFIEWVPVRHGYDYNKEWLDEVILTHDIQMVNYDGTLRPMGVEESLTVTFETIVFRSR